MKKLKTRTLRILLAGSVLVVVAAAFSVISLKKAISHSALNQKQNISADQPVALAPDVKATDLKIPPTNLSDVNKVVPPAKQNNIPAIPILEYHHIRDFTNQADGANYYTSVSPDHFQSQMKDLKNAGYATISFADYLKGKKTAKSIIITFDDGDEDAYTQAYPVLQSLGFKGVFYIISSFIDQPNYLTVGQIKEMSDNGMIIGSHTVDHADLTKIDQSLVLNQLTASKTAIENIVGKPVTNFCYPFGGYNKLIISMVKQAGYTTATSTRQAGPGAFQNYLAIPRVNVPPGLSASTLLQRIAGIEGES